MSSDVLYSHRHRLPGPAHTIEPRDAQATYFSERGPHSPSSASAASSRQPFTVSGSSWGPSSHRITQLTFDHGLNSDTISGYGKSTSAGVGPSSRRRYDFPPTYTDQATLAEHRKARLQRMLDPSSNIAGGSLGTTWGDEPWNWRNEEIYVEPRHLPPHPQASMLSVGDDPLPSEQHPSYPYGRPVQARPASMHPRATLPNAVQTSRHFQSEAAVWNGQTAGGNAAGSGAGEREGVPHAGQEGAGGGSDEALSKPLTTLPAYLARLKSSAISASTTHPSSGSTSSQLTRASAEGWPFVRFGPGPSLPKRRDESEGDSGDPADAGAAAAAREVWLERDFERLLPTGRERDPLEYLRSGLLKQRYDEPTSEPSDPPPSRPRGELHRLDRIQDEVIERMSKARQQGDIGDHGSAEAQGTKQLRRIFAGAGKGRLDLDLEDPSGQELARSGSVAQGSSSHARGQLPALLLDESGADAEDLRDLLVGARARSHAGSRTFDPMYVDGASSPRKRAGRVPREAAEASSSAAGAFGTGQGDADVLPVRESTWMTRARAAAQKRADATMPPAAA